MRELIDSGWWWIVFITIPALAFVLYWFATRGTREHQAADTRTAGPAPRRHYPNTVTLVNRMHHVSREQRTLIVLIAMITVVVIAVLFITMFDLPLDPAALDWQVVRDKLRRKLSEAPLHTLVFLLPIPLSIIQFVVMGFNKRARLVLSETGIGYRSGWPGFLQRFRPDWRLAWQALEAVEPAQRNAFGTVQPGAFDLVAGDQTRRVFPHLWFDPDEPPREGWRERLVVNAALDSLKLLAVLERSIVIQYLRDAGFEVKLEPVVKKAQTLFVLESSPHTIAALVLLAVLVAYAFIDGIALPETYVDVSGPLFTGFVALGVVAGLAVLGWLLAARIPAPESAVIALLTGVVVGVAAYPAALRLNMLTDSEGLQAYPYHVRHGVGPEVRLEPLDPALPVIDYFRWGPYWARFGQEDRYPVMLRSGGLGFYQFHQASIIDDIRRFEEGETR